METNNIDSKQLLRDAISKVKTECFLGIESDISRRLESYLRGSLQSEPIPMIFKAMRIIAKLKNSDTSCLSSMVSTIIHDLSVLHQTQPTLNSSTIELTNEMLRIILKGNYDTLLCDEINTNLSEFVEDLQRNI